MKVKLKEIGKIITGNTPSKQNTLYYNSNDILFIKPDVLQLKKVCDINDSKEFISENARAVSRIVPKGSLLITCIGIIGKIGIVGIDECAFNQQINAIVPNNNIKSKYLAYVLFYNRGRLNDIANAPVVPIINKSEFENFEVNIIGDIKKQESIIQILDKIENIIYKYECVLNYLDTLIKARFAEMFGDPMHNNVNFPFVRLKEFSKLITKGASPNWQGFSYTKDQNQTLFVTSENVRNGYLELSNAKFIEDGFNKKQSRSIVINGDVLINIVGASIGRAAIFDLDIKANTNQAVALVRLKEGVINKVYLNLYLNSEKAKVMYDKMKSDTGRANLSLNDIGNLLILSPPIGLQNKFATFVHHVDKLKFDVQKSLEKTQMLFDSLMQEYFG